MRAIGAASYMGVPLLDLDGKILGHLAVLDKRPMPEEPRAQPCFRYLLRVPQPSCVACVRKRRCANAKKNSAGWLTAPWTRSLSSTAILTSHRSKCGGRKSFRLLVAARSWASSSPVFCLPIRAKRLATLIVEIDLRPEGERYAWIPGGLKAKSRFRRRIPRRSHALSVRHGTGAILHVDSKKR